MAHQSVILARIQPGREAEVAEIFGRSDETDLPARAGVVSRHLYVLDDVYVHVLETEAPFGAVFGEIAGHPEFRRVSDELGHHVSPLHPDRWRSPRDANARCFYRWTARPVAAGPGGTPAVPPGGAR